jgi:ubiquinol-cytochrome c reductase iron-sulfur subunit
VSDEHRPLEPGDDGSQPPADDAGHDQELIPARQTPVPDPGLPAHRLRPTDTDPAAERRAERQVAALFTLSAIATIGSIVAYFSFDESDTFLGVGASNFWLGTCLGVALFAIGAGAIQWAKRLMPDVEVVEERHSLRSSDTEREAVARAFEQGSAASGFGRRSLIRGSLLGAMGLLGLPAVVLLWDLGPTPKDRPSRTMWTAGMRILTDVTYQPIRPSDLRIGSLVNGMPAGFLELPEHGPDRIVSRGRDAIIVVRLTPDEIKTQQGPGWDYQGIIAYSKICTHVGCPINLYEKRTHHLLCPCHQSTYDLADSARVLFGPAGRNLPQLAVDVDDEGYLIARQGFAQPVGPSFWERG